jgi:hypothetical protein
MDCAAFQVCLEDRVAGNRAINDEKAIDKFAETLTGNIKRDPNGICFQEPTTWRHLAFFTR